MNLDINSVSGEILSISQFTLSWDGSGGHRPSFEKSMLPQEARLKYALFNRELRTKGLIVKEGKFGAFMKVSLVNDGPVTFVLNF
jgi:D-tyrosyl-tRNA(Tyr) deacylase